MKQDIFRVAWFHTLASQVDLSIQRCAKVNEALHIVSSKSMCLVTYKSVFMYKSIFSLYELCSNMNTIANLFLVLKTQHSEGFHFFGKLRELSHPNWQVIVFLNCSDQCHNLNSSACLKDFAVNADEAGCWNLWHFQKLQILLLHQGEAQPCQSRIAFLAAFFAWLLSFCLCLSAAVCKSCYIMIINCYDS